MADNEATVTDLDNAQREANELADVMAMPVLELPGDYENEVMANELLSHLTSYHAAVVAARAARHAKDHAQAEKMDKVALYSQIAAGILQRKYPKSVAIYQALALARAKAAQSSRETQRSNPG